MSVYSPFAPTTSTLGGSCACVGTMQRVAGLHLATARCRDAAPLCGRCNSVTRLVFGDVVAVGDFEASRKLYGHLKFIVKVQCVKDIWHDAAVLQRRLHTPYRRVIKRSPP